MTAEQLEELLHRSESHDAGWYSAQTELILLAPSLARRVICAEKLVESAEAILCGLVTEDSWSAYEVSKLLGEITAYREASK